MSGRVLGLVAELEYSIRSNQNEKITPEEEQYFRNLKDHYVDVFSTSCIVSSLITWKATKKYSFLPRFFYSAGACFIGGYWGVRLVEHSSLDPIFEADGSRMQRELANIMLARHQMDSVKSSFISTHLYKLLYPEQVFGDKYPDKSFVRWRLRNVYEDSSVALSILNPPTDSIPQTETKLMKSMGVEKPGIGEVLIADPMDCIFDHTETSGNNANSDESMRTKRISRAQRRARRKHEARERGQSARAAADTKFERSTHQNPNDW